MPAEPGPYLSDPSGQVHPLHNAVTRMGRAVENEIVILDKRSSREHAVIRREGRRSILEDQSSTNGTSLNGERLQHAVQLRDGDQVTVGDIAFTFHDPEMTSVETPFPELDVNLEAAEIRVDRRLVQLSSKEFALLAYLYENRSKVCSKDDIGQVVWSEYSRAFSITRSKTWYAACAPRSKTTRTRRNCWSPCAGWGISWWVKRIWYTDNTEPDGFSP